MELVSCCANRTLIVSCTRICTWVWGGGLRVVGGPWAPRWLAGCWPFWGGGFGVVPAKCFWSGCFVSWFVFFCCLFVCITSVGEERANLSAVVYL